MSAVAKVDVRDARQRAGQIRQGIHNYLETLALIAQAWAERDWRTLAYDSWDAYVAEEFGETRLRLPTEHREKAVRELRLAGMSQRAIGAVVGVPQSQVSRDLAASDSPESDAESELPATTLSLDGRHRPATQPARRTKKSDRQPAAEAEDQPEEVPAEGLTPGLDDGAEDTPSVEAEGVAAPTAGDSSSSLPNGSGQQTPAPSPAVTDFLAKDESLQRAHYLHAFMKVLTRSDDFMEFEPEKLAELADLELVESLTSYLTRVSNFVDRFQKARKERGGLRVLNGGRR